MGLVYNATINRDGIGGYWVEKDLPFDASLMHVGKNTMTLDHSRRRIDLRDHLRLHPAGIAVTA